MAVDFETALQLLQKSESLTRSQAVDRLRAARDANDPEIKNVSGLTEGLLVSRYVERPLASALSGGITAFAEPFEAVGGALGIIGKRPSTAFREQVAEQSGINRPAEITGELIGSGPEFSAGEGALGLAGMAPGMLRRAIVGGTIGGLQTGTVKGAATGAAVAAFLPPAIDIAAGAAVKGLGIVGRRLFDRPLPPEVAPALEQAPPIPEAPKVPDKPIGVTWAETPATAAVDADVQGIAGVESDFGQNVGHPRPGRTAAGPYQMTEALRADHGVSLEDALDPVRSKEWATRIYNSYLNEFKSRELALSAWHQGPTWVREHGVDQPYVDAVNAKMGGAGGAPTSTSETLNAARRSILPGGEPSETSTTLTAAGAVFRPPEMVATKPGFAKTAEDLLAEREAADTVHVGTVNVRTGQPFTGESTVLLSTDRGRVYVNADSPDAGLGTPGRVEVANPAVFNVHEQPYRDALEQVFPNNTKLLDLYDSVDKPEDLAREVLGRFAKRKGFDSVVLRAPDPKHDLILDFKEFATKPHEGLSRGLSTEVRSTKPPQSIFASKALDREEVPFERTSDHEAFGFASEGDMAATIRAARMSPWEAFKASAKSPGRAAPPIMSEMGGVLADVSKFVERVEPEFMDAVRATASRHPVLMDAVSRFSVDPMPAGYENAIAITSMYSDGSLHIRYNPSFLPGTAVAEKYAASRGLTAQEVTASVLEHELAHVAQYWADTRGLGKALGVPSMHSPETDVTTTGPVEGPAYGRQWAVEDFFKQHRAMQDRVAQIPDDIQSRVLAADAKVAQEAMKPVVRRTYSHLKGKGSVQIWASRTPGWTPEDMDGFDSDSRSQFDEQFDPDNLLPPETRQMFDLMNKYGKKGGAPFRRPVGVSDHPDHQYFISKVFEFARDRVKTINTFNKNAAKILKDVKLEDYDKTWEAVEGLRRDASGKLTQTVPDVAPKIQATAVRLRERVMDALYEHVKGIDRRAPAILKDLGLEDKPATWQRIQLLQRGLRDKVKNPLLSEFTAAKRMEGMLRFDSSHDLRGEFVDGYLTHQPIDNELTELTNQIYQQDRLDKLTGGAVKDPDGQAVRAERIKRLTEIKLQMARQQIAGLPSSDRVPKKAYFGPMLVKDHPGASKAMIIDKNLPHVLGRYVNGAISKHYFDQVLDTYSQVAKKLPPSVREFDAQYVNNIRGVRGYKEDLSIVQMVNSFNRTLGRGKEQMTIGQLREGVRKVMAWNNVFKLYLNQIRFPIIQASHVALTSGVVDPEATTKGIAYFLSKPKQAVLEAMAAGVIDKDPEFVGAIDEISPAQGGGKLLKNLTALQKYPDYFRKVATYHGFRLRAMEPGFKPDPIIRTFIKEVPGRNSIKMANEYGAAATDTLQFRMRAEGKPQAFVGGVARRMWGQFKQWPINIGGLYADVLKTGTTAQKARLLGTLWFFGGLSMGTGKILFDPVRNELLKHGVVLPQTPGWQTIANAMGIGGALDYVDIASLHDVAGMPRSLAVGDLASWAGGPILGGVADFADAMVRAKGDTSKMTKAAISAVSPQIRAGIDAWEEYKQGGVRTPQGRMLAMRDPAALIVRGLDLSPSVKSQHFQYKQDIITALEGGQKDAARELLREAKSKGLIFGPKDLREIKAATRQEFKRRAIIAHDPESALR